jgi:hypothetical protein
VGRGLCLSELDVGVAGAVAECQGEGSSLGEGARVEAELLLQCRKCEIACVQRWLQVARHRHLQCPNGMEGCSLKVIALDRQ